MGGNGYPGIIGVDGPYDAQYHGDDSGHAEAEHHGGEDELVPSGSVELEDGHVGCSADHEEDEKDGAYWDIDADCRQAAKASGGSWIGRMQGHFVHGRSLRGETLAASAANYQSIGKTHLSGVDHCGRHDERM